MTDGWVLGVDLGTSHTVAMLRRPDGRTRPLLFDGQPLLPSAVYLDTTGRLHVGRDAVRLGQAEPGRLEPNPKRSVDAETVLLGGAEVPTVDLFAALLSAVAREAVAAAGFLPPAVLTHPAAWGARRREVLTTALARAGWPPATGSLPEPVAAARYFADVLRRPVPVGSALAVFDFGGGTLDVAVVRNEGATPQGLPRFVVAASGGLDDLGGLDLDAALVEHLGAELGKSEPAGWAALTEPVTLAQWRARRQFWDDVRGAKEMLSRTPLAPVPVPGVEHAVHLNRDEFEAAAAPLLRRGVAETEAVIRAAGLAPTELAGLFLVGGSSRVPLVARLLHGELGIAPVVLEQPELPVAEGATIVASTSPQDARTQADPPRPATVPPVADTVTQPASAQADTGSPQPHSQPPPQPDYAEPVDPWATGEAAAFGNAGGGPMLHPVSGAPVPASPVSASPAGSTPPGADSWLASTHPEPSGPPEARAELPAYRRRMRWIVAAATVVLLGGAATVVALFWPGHPALDYQPLDGLHRIAPAVPVTSAFNATALRDGRAYFAGVDDNGTLGVVAAATDTGETAWTSTAAGTASRWESFFTLPDAVVAMTASESGTNARRMVMLDPGDGKKLWERTIDGNDSVLFAGDKAVLVDRREGRLVGLAVRGRGKGVWESPNPKTEYGQAGTQVVAVTTEEDFAGPASAAGNAFAEPLDDDRRIVQIGADDSARVIDADTGAAVAGPRQSVAQTDDKIIAHNGRLIVAESTNAHRLFAYDLKKLEPKVLYTPPSANSRLEHLVPCGNDRICLVETTGSDAKSAQVVAVDAADGGVVWRRSVADADNLVAVGQAVLVARNTSPAQVSLLDADGRLAWTRGGAAGRLDAGNTLQFSRALATSPDDPALAGEHLGDDAVPLGPLAGVRSATCAWDTSHLACVAAEDFVVQRFAG